jgi:hypothetical protein
MCCREVRNEDVDWNNLARDVIQCEIINFCVTFRKENLFFRRKTVGLSRRALLLDISLL